jgi:hypothetical protein
MTEQPGKRARRRTNWIYAVLITFMATMIVLGIVVKIVLPRVVEGMQLDRLTEAPFDVQAARSPVEFRPIEQLKQNPDHDYAKAVRWIAARIGDDADLRAEVIERWQDGPRDDASVVRVGLAFAQGDALGKAPADLRIRYHVLTAISPTLSTSKRILGVTLLMQFPDENAEVLAAVLGKLAGDENVDVAVEVASVLPRWSHQDWAGKLLMKMLEDDRVQVRRQAALAAGLFAPASTWMIGSGLIGGGNLFEETDTQVRINLCWSLMQLGWGVSIVHPSDLKWPTEPMRWLPLAFRGIAALPVSMHVTNADTGEERIHFWHSKDSLGELMNHASDPVVLERAGMVLALIYEDDLQVLRDKATPRPATNKWRGVAIPDRFINKLLASRRWRSIAIAARLIGLTADTERLTALEQLVVLDDRPDLVSEQAAFALGRIIRARAGNRDRETTQPDDPVAQKARAALLAMVDRSLIRRPATNADTQPDNAAVSPRTRLAVAEAFADCDGTIEPLLALTEVNLTADQAGDLSPETLADFAVIELVDRAEADQSGTLRGRVIARARKLLFGSFSDRSQRSGALLIGLLGDAESKDRLRRRWQVQSQGPDKITAIYLQVAMKLLGDDSVDARVPAVGWLNDPEAVTPGVLVGLARAGEAVALETLLTGSPERPRGRRVLAYMDDWRLRSDLFGWVKGTIEPIPLADPELTALTARMSSWWYRTHRFRLSYAPDWRGWKLDDQ